MHRSRVERFAIACVGMWVMLMQVDSRALHSCPMHDAPAAQQESHAHHSAPAAGGTHHGSQAPEGNHACSCLGQCCVAATTALAAPSVTGLLVAPPAVRVVTPVGRATIVSAERLLPFANGPPAITAQ